jgi:hypothetical protein
MGRKSTSLPPRQARVVNGRVMIGLRGLWNRGMPEEGSRLRLPRTSYLALPILGRQSVRFSSLMCISEPFEHACALDISLVLTPGLGQSSRTVSRNDALASCPKLPVQCGGCLFRCCPSRQRRHLRLNRLDRRAGRPTASLLGAGCRVRRAAVLRLRDPVQGREWLVSPSYRSNMRGY